MNTETKVGTFVIVCLLLLGVTVYFISNEQWGNHVTLYRTYLRYAGGVGPGAQVLFGGIEVDLRDADMETPAVVLHANAVFGGIEIRVPDTWYVETRGQGVFGGYTDETMPPDVVHYPNPKRLVVKGAAVFGGVVVKN